MVNVTAGEQALARFIMTNIGITRTTHEVNDILCIHRCQRLSPPDDAGPVEDHDLARLRLIAVKAYDYLPADLKLFVHLKGWLNGASDSD